MGSELFQKIQNTPYAHQISVAFIRSMKLAVYAKGNVGHYGLALDHYCHFTSPIRRYSDLVVHRLVFDPTPPKDLDYIAKMCSEKERISFKAENSVVQLKKLRLLRKWQNEDPSRVFIGVITKIKPHGIQLDIQPLSSDGFIHISKIGDDYFEFNPRDETITGRNSGETFQIGQKLHVQLRWIDLITLQTEWEMQEGTSKKSKKKEKKKKKKLKKR